ncbi:unnamed protein product, partial [Chrysoparadoxa australica]
EGRYRDISELTDLQLANLQTSKSSWHARRARVTLQERTVKGPIKTAAINRLNKILNTDGNIDFRLRALWSLHVSGGITKKQLTSLLKDKNEYIRAWAIQLLCEDKSVTPETLERFRKLAIGDQSPVVRLYLSAALQRLQMDQRWDIAMALSKHKADITDHNIPHMLWFGIEPLINTNPTKYLELAATSKIPMITQYMARRMVDADEIERLVGKAALIGENQADLLKGLRDGLESRPGSEAPDNWEAAYSKISKQGGEAAEIALNIAQQLGDRRAAQHYMATLKDGDANIDSRIAALNGLAKQQWNELPDLLPSLQDPPAIRNPPIKAFAAFDGNLLGTIM